MLTLEIESPQSFDEVLNLWRSMSDKHEPQGGQTAFQAAANSPIENQEDEARPLPSNGYSR